MAWLPRDPKLIALNMVGRNMVNLNDRETKSGTAFRILVAVVDLLSSVASDRWHSSLPKTHSDTQSAIRHSRSRDP